MINNHYGLQRNTGGYMEKICPVCNNIFQEIFPCSHCNGKMLDQGRISDYYDNYSADMPIENEDIYCTHIYVCENCGELHNFKIKMVNA
jgi:hypothetical protein